MKNKSIISIVAFIIFIVAIGVISGVIVHNKESEINKLNSKNQNLSSNVAERDSTINDLFASMDEIERNLTLITQKRTQLEIKQDEVTVSQKELIMEDIRQLDVMLEENMKKIKNLENRLYKSGVKITALNQKIESLAADYEEQNKQIIKFKQTLEERDIQIAELNTQFENLQVESEWKDQSLAEKEELITDQTNELNKAYLAFGTYKELKETGVVQKEGGIFGIGGDKSFQENVVDENFMQVDIREINKIPLFSKKANFITEHPDSSYHFLEDEGLITYLEIEKPEEFWKISKYAVIETK